jgi:hypothetical protein
MAAPRAFLAPLVLTAPALTWRTASRARISRYARAALACAVVLFRVMLCLCVLAAGFCWKCDSMHVMHWWQGAQRKSHCVHPVPGRHTAVRRVLFDLPAGHCVWPRLAVLILPFWLHSVCEPGERCDADRAHGHARVLHFVRFVLHRRAAWCAPLAPRRTAYSARPALQARSRHQAAKPSALTALLARTSLALARLGAWIALQDLCRITLPLPVRVCLALPALWGPAAALMRAVVCWCRLLSLWHRHVRARPGLVTVHVLLGWPVQQRRQQVFVLALPRRLHHSYFWPS